MNGMMLHWREVGRLGKLEYGIKISKFELLKCTSLNSTDGKRFAHGRIEIKPEYMKKLQKTSFRNAV